MWRDIYWNQQSEDHIAKHEVTPAEVDEVVNTRPRYETKGRDETLLVFGQTDAGRPLTIVLAKSTAEPDSWFVVTAREMEQHEARTFRDKGR